MSTARGAATDAADRGDDPILAVIPAYNAASMVPEVIRATRAYLPVLVVDDGSSDGTSEAARAAGAEVIRQEPNRGKGAALKQAFLHAAERGCPAVLTLDADGQHAPEDIPAFLHVWEESRPDLVIGARDFDEMPFVRRMANSIGRRSISWAAGRHLPDNQSGYRLVSHRLAVAMLESGEGGFEFEVEMVLLCLRRGWSIEWVPIQTIYEGQESHIRPVRHVIQFFRMVAKARKAARSAGGGD